MTPARLGPAQRRVLLLMIDGTDRSAARVALDLMIDYRDAYRVLSRLWRRSLVDRAFSHDSIEWHLTRAGDALAAELFPDGEDPEDDQ
jgi:DNA-binding MarR family transcriptional regulator